MSHENNLIEPFFALLGAGMWEKDVSLLPYGSVNFEALHELASQQTVMGLIAGGMGHIKAGKPERVQIIPFVSSIVAIEQRNIAMNAFINRLSARLKESHIPFVLLKGQGVARCYPHPLWRNAGDVDLLLDSRIR